jgi:hypothetical protein
MRHGAWGMGHRVLRISDCGLRIWLYAEELAGNVEEELRRKNIQSVLPFWLLILDLFDFNGLTTSAISTALTDHSFCLDSRHSDFVEIPE